MYPFPPPFIRQQVQSLLRSQHTNSLQGYSSTQNSKIVEVPCIYHLQLYGNLSKVIALIREHVIL